MIYVIMKYISMEWSRHSMICIPYRMPIAKVEYVTLYFDLTVAFCILDVIHSLVVGLYCTKTAW